MQRRTILANAVAAALGVAGAGPALAAGTIGVPSPVAPAPHVFANEITAPLTLTGAAVQPAAGAIGFGVSGGQSVFLRFDLSGDGAKFKNAPTLAVNATGTRTVTTTTYTFTYSSHITSTCFPTSTGPSCFTFTTYTAFTHTHIHTGVHQVGAIVVHGTLVAGGAGESDVIFQVTAPGGANGGIKQGNTYTLSPAAQALALSSVGASATIAYGEYATAPDAANQTSALAAASTTLLKFAQTLYGAGAPGASLKIDVSSNDTVFTTGAGGTTSVSPIGELALANASARLGRYVSAGVIGDTNLDAGSGAANPLLATGTGKDLLTVTGDFAAAPTTASGALDPAAVFLNSASNCAGTTLAAATTLTATQATFTLGNLALGTFSDTQATGFATVCYQVSGTAPIQFGVTYKGSYAPTGATGYTLQGSYPFTLATLTSNGAHAQVLNIPSGTTGGDAPYIRIYNTSSIAGPIRGTLYAQDGSVLYNGVLIPSLAPGQVQVLDAQQLQSLAGGSWSGRARLDVFGQIPAMDVQALVRTANGTLVNVSAKAPGGSP